MLGFQSKIKLALVTSHKRMCVYTPNEMNDWMVFKQSVPFGLLSIITHEWVSQPHAMHTHVAIYLLRYIDR